MEGIVILVILGVLALPVLALAFAVSARNRSLQLEYKLSQIEKRLSALAGSMAAGAMPERNTAAPSTSEPAPSKQPESEDESTALSEAMEGLAGESAASSKEEPGIAARDGDSGEIPPANGDDVVNAAGAPFNAGHVRKPRRSLADIESLAGAKWSVILGGLALALGAIFLVRHTIEAGLLGPRARIALGFALAAALFAGGEWLRRRDRTLQLPVFAKADIPGILTGAGSLAAFATLYAAYALYGFIGPAMAFIGLTVIGLASLLLSAIHGPKLAALGVLGAYGAPALVSTDTPNAIALAAHVIVVTASVFAIARLREWIWLAFAAMGGITIWTILAAGIGGSASGIAGLAMLAGFALMLAATFGWQLAESPEPGEDRPVDRAAIIGYLALLVAAFAQFGANEALPDTFAGVLTGILVMAAAAYWPAFAPAAIIAALVAAFAIAANQLEFADLPGRLQGSDLATGIRPRDINGYVMSAAAVGLAPAMLAIAGAWKAGPEARRWPGWLAASVSMIAFLAVLISWSRVSPFETRPLFGAIALVLAAGLAGLTAAFDRLRPGDNTAPAPAAYAVGAVALVSLAIALSLSKGWMPIAFALASLGIAWIWTLRPVGILPWLSVAAAVLGGAALWFSAPFARIEIGTTPFFNGLITLAGLPSLAVLAAGELLRRRGAERPASFVTALGLACLGLFTGLEIRHWLTGGNIATGRFDLAEMAGQTIAALAFAIGLQRVARLTQATIYDKAALAAGGLSALFIAFGLFLIHNPFLTGASVGAGRVANLLLPAYLLPGLLAGWTAWLARPLRPRWYTLGYALLSGLLLFIYASLMTRHGFQGEYLGMARRTGQNEIWAYSAVWLVLGAAVLTLGHWLKSLPVRLAGGILIALTVCKVFLVDLSSLEGALRAFSFLGLGLCLLAIGRFYQRVIVGTPVPGEQEGEEA